MTEKGQVTIPKRLRDRLGILPGEEVEFEEGGPGRLVLRKLQTRDRIDAAYGLLDLGAPTDELVLRLRGEPDVT